MKKYSNLVDVDGNGDGYSGTFRWKSSKILGKIAPPSRPPTPVKGWMTYFMSRSSDSQIVEDLVSKVRSDLSLVDCLSSPVSIGMALLSHIFQQNKKQEQINVICLGCAEKAEGRILRETNCWNELAYILQPYVSELNLWLVGPEMRNTECVPLNDFFPFREYSHFSFNTHTFRGGCQEFFRYHTNYITSSSTVCVGINTGFGNFENPLPARYSLLKSWYSDLSFLTGLQIPLIFTCTNDYADLSGEVSLMRFVFGANFFIFPYENPFKFASTLVSDDSSSRNISNDESSYSCGNSFVYGVQGFDPTKRRLREISQNSSNLDEIIRKLLVVLAKEVKLHGDEDIKVRPLVWSKSCNASAAKPMDSPKDEDRIDPSEVISNIDIYTPISMMSPNISNDVPSENSCDGPEKLMVKEEIRQCSTDRIDPFEFKYYNMDVCVIDQNLDQHTGLFRISLQYPSFWPPNSGDRISIMNIEMRFYENRKTLKLFYHSSLMPDDLLPTIEICAVRSMLENSIQAKFSSKKCQLTLQGNFE